MARNITKESELAAIVVSWLESQHWDVYQEVVTTGGVADIVAVKEGIVWVVETKLQLGLDVLSQIYGRKWCHMRSVAVLSPKKHSSERDFAMKIAQEMCTCGVLEINDNYNSLRVIHAAPLMRGNHAGAKKLLASLKPEHKTFAKAGSSSGGHYTPYKSTIENVRRLLSANPDGLTTKEIMDQLAKHHYRTDASARSALPSALRKYESDWCEMTFVGAKMLFKIKKK